MKKIVIFLLFVFGIIGIFIYNYSKPRGYEISYELDDFNVTEKYDTEDNYYYFTISKGDYLFEYPIDMKYMSSRRVVEHIDKIEEKDTLCIHPTIKGVKKIDTICYTGEMYLSESLALDKKEDSPKKINDYNSVEIYDKDIDFLVWNNKGFTNLNEKKDYNFLDKEIYDNQLSYIYEQYIIVADYDASRYFNKFYVYDNSTKKISELEFDFDISFDSYFMGDYEDEIYLFDKKSKTQYKIDIKDKKVSKSSDSNGAFYLDIKPDTMPLNKLSYNTYSFNYDKEYNYKLDNNILMMNYHNSKINIKLSDKKVSHILYQTDDTVYYLVEEKLYSLNRLGAERLLLINFEWNFSYLNKIYIFD